MHSSGRILEIKGIGSVEFHRCRMLRTVQFIAGYNIWIYLHLPTYLVLFRANLDLVPFPDYHDPQSLPRGREGPALECVQGDEANLPVFIVTHYVSDLRIFRHYIDSGYRYFVGPLVEGYRSLPPPMDILFTVSILLMFKCFFSLTEIHISFSLPSSLQAFQYPAV